jgi:hypothetical protein
MNRANYLLKFFFYTNKILFKLKFSRDDLKMKVKYATIIVEDMDESINFTEKLWDLK